MTDIQQYISSISTNDRAKYISIKFLKQDNEDFLNEFISNTHIDINIIDDQFILDLGMDESLEGYELYLVFDSIQVIRELSDSKPYFLSNITNLTNATIGYLMNKYDEETHLEQDIKTLNIKRIVFNDLLLINATYNERGEIIPIQSTKLFKFQGINNDLYVCLYNCLSKHDAEVAVIKVTCINCFCNYYNDDHLIVSGDIPEKIYSSLPINILDCIIPNEDNNTVKKWIRSINKPPVSNITNLPIPINTSGDNASSINLTGITF